VLEKYDEGQEVVSDEAAFFTYIDALPADIAVLRSMQSNYFF